MTTEPTDPLEGLTEFELDELHGEYGMNKAITARSFAEALAAERRENARLREVMENAKASVAAFLADCGKQECIVDESGEVIDLMILRHAFAGEVKAKP